MVAFTNQFMGRHYRLLRVEYLHGSLIIIVLNDSRNENRKSIPIYTIVHKKLVP